MPTTIGAAEGISFSSFYYPELLREVLLFLRRNRVELGLTDENVFEVHVQLARAFALIGHNNNTRLDVVATELLLDSSSLLESVKRLLRLIGIELNSASPSVVDVLLTLSSSTSVSVPDFIPELAAFATESLPAITFEALTAQDLDRTDEVSYAFGLEEAKSGTGSVATGSPDIFTRTAGSVFAAGDLASHIFVPTGLSDNGGELRITEFIDANNVRVVRVPGSTSPGFQTETGLAWSLKTFTANGATSVNAAGPTFTPWASVVAGDLLLIGHKHALWGQVDLTFDTVGADVTGVFEYPDNRLSVFEPVSAVDNFDGTLTFNVTSLLGLVERTGAEIIVTYLPTGVKERISSSFGSGDNEVISQTYFGQVSPSEVEADYSITADWVPLENQVDGSSDLTVDGSLTYTFPHSETRSWLLTEVNLLEAFWLRYRVISVSGPTEPILDEVDLDSGSLHTLASATQGETIGPQILGSSDGSVSQEFGLPDTPYLDNTETIEVDETGGSNWVEYTRVLNFLNSQTTSRHYMREVDAEDTAKVIFGDGTNGKIPPSGSDNVRGTYRVGGDIDGNIAAAALTVNADGITGVSSITNPRAAVGWRMKDGGTAEDLERVKRDAPAALRTRDRGINTDDIARLAINDFVNSDDIKPVARAFAIEEGLGVKTVKLLVVGAGGDTLTSTEKAELDEYFNGNRNARPPVAGVLMANHEVTSFNYDPENIAVQATVVWPGGNAEAVRNALQSLLHPLALEEDGVTFVWDFAGNVSQSRIFAAVHAVDSAVEDVSTLLLNAADASWQLGANGLPTTTAASITVNIAES